MSVVAQVGLPISMDTYLYLQYLAPKGEYIWPALKIPLIKQDMGGAEGKVAYIGMRRD
jgi:hypothetical protein